MSAWVFHIRAGAARSILPGPWGYLTYKPWGCRRGLPRMQEMLSNKR